MRIQNLSLILSALLLSLPIACGGGSTPAPQSVTAASGLVYSDPAITTGWRLVKDDSSTPSRLILNLVGPTGTKTRGVGFNLQAPPTVQFGAFPNGLAINDTGVYQLLGAGSTDTSEPIALISGLKSGNLLTVGIYQKDRNQAAQDSSSALCQIAILFDSTKGLSIGDKLPLQITKAKVIPEDIGLVTDEPWILDRKMKMADISIALGALSAK